jgi:uncharacterized iron-regulated membrane protein
VAERSWFHGEEGYYDALVSTRLRRLHRWLGVATGPFVLLFALSGVALLARDGLEAVLEGAPPPLRVAGAAAPPASVVEIARARFPGAEPRGVRAPRRVDEAYRVLLDWRGERVEVWVDPYAREVTRTRLPDRSVLVAIHSLHASLHLGRVGHALVALLGLALALQGALGVWLWWPRPRREPGRVALPLHRVVGAAAMAGSLVLALSGAYLAARHVAAPPPAARASDPSDDDLAARLHRGDVGGWAGRAAWTLTGLALPVLVLSGYALAVSGRDTPR